MENLLDIKNVVVFKMIGSDLTFVGQRFGDDDKQLRVLQPISLSLFYDDKTNKYIPISREYFPFSTGSGPIHFENKDIVVWDDATEVLSNYYRQLINNINFMQKDVIDNSLTSATLEMRKVLDNHLMEQKELEQINSKYIIN